MKYTDHKMHESYMEFLAHLVSPCVYNTRVIKDTSLNTQFVSDKVMTCKITQKCNSDFNQMTIPRGG